MCEYPRKGVWVMGFHTGPALNCGRRQMSANRSRCSFPPRPARSPGTRGDVPANDVVDLPITVDEAIRFAVSGGVLVPEPAITGAGALTDGHHSGLIPIPASRIRGGEAANDNVHDAEQRRSSSLALMKYRPYHEFD